MPGIGIGIGNRLGFFSGGIPLQSSALVWLDGELDGNEFVDKSGNARNFTITNKDFTANYFPYKSAATISAPVGDATLIAADVNNFLYGPGADLNVSNCANFDMTTFANATPTGFDATSNGSATHRAGTADEIAQVIGQKYEVSFDFVLNSGTAPSYDIQNALNTASRSDEGPQLAVVGKNKFKFTRNGSTTNGVVAFINSSTATDYEIKNLSVGDDYI